MIRNKISATASALLALGLGFGVVDQAIADGHCGRMAGYHPLYHDHAMMHRDGYHYGCMPGPMRMTRLAPRPTMYWGAQQPKLVRIANTEAAGEPSGDIVDVAVSAGSFNTLAAALQAAELIDTLKGEGPFTVFAPTDDAFAKIPQDQLDALLADKDQLTAVLTYHVVPGKVMAADVIGLDSATTVQGGALEIDTADGVKIGEATVIQTDIEASNGVIHVIDTVLIPK
jgi:uncharacterized surface protein with fasciclin (FAS1) repeats